MKFYTVDEPDKMDEKFIEMGLRALPTNEGVTVLDVKRRHIEGILQIWRYESEHGRGIMVTEIYGQEQELFVWLAAGEKMFACAPDMMRALEHTAKCFGLTKIRASCVPWVGMKLVDVCGFSIESVGIVKEVPLGRPEE